MSPAAAVQDSLDPAVRAHLVGVMLGIPNLDPEAAPGIVVLLDKAAPLSLDERVPARHGEFRVYLERVERPTEL